ncbi:MAG: MBL fold metallo-hydrolase [Rhizobiales bacterium NRL2]|jgi:glyoxylase-like metal-dependent hydrolase (beta-lactamase superfamily II)|nr:MAG: MBL fold metallo-hydrolase [Rhizobiales bacterium NRL2]
MTDSERLAIRAFFDEATNTISYLVWDRETMKAAVIDPVLDYDNRSGRASTHSADAILEAAKAEGVELEWILETHAHADHLSAAPHIKRATGARIGIGEHITDVQGIFGPFFNLDNVSGDGAEFDHLFRDGETFRIGGLTVEVMHLPGHTPACIAYHVEDAVFVGDTIFMPDYGTARADFPGGDARTLYRSIQRLLSLSDETRLFMCHDYKAPGRDEYAWETTVGAEKENVHLAGKGEDDFVAWREERDAGLAAPMLLLPSIQTNIRAGRLPDPEANGTRYLKLPITLANTDDSSA